MSLIIYPTLGYNSFVTVQRADEIMSSFANDKGWSGFDTPTKETNLKQAFILIAMCPKFKPPDTSEFALEQAQVMLTLYYIDKDPFDVDKDAAAVKREKLGGMEIEYQAGMRRGDKIVYPSYVTQFLKPYGCTGSAGTRQARVGAA